MTATSTTAATTTATTTTDTTTTDATTTTTVGAASVGAAVAGSLTRRGTYGHRCGEAVQPQLFACIGKLCAECGDDCVAPHEVLLAVLQLQGGALVRCVGLIQRLLHLDDGLRDGPLAARRHVSRARAFDADERAALAGVWGGR